MRLMTETDAKLTWSQTDMIEPEIKPVTNFKLNLFHTQRL